MDAATPLTRRRRTEVNINILTAEGFILLALLVFMLWKLSRAIGKEYLSIQTIADQFSTLVLKWSLLALLPAIAGGVLFHRQPVYVYVVFMLGPLLLYALCWFGVIRYAVIHGFAHPIEWVDLWEAQLLGHPGHGERRPGMMTADEQSFFVFMWNELKQKHNINPRTKTLEATLIWAKNVPRWKGDVNSIQMNVRQPQYQILKREKGPFDNAAGGITRVYEAGYEEKNGKFLPVFSLTMRTGCHDTYDTQGQWVRFAWDTALNSVKDLLIYIPDRPKVRNEDVLNKEDYLVYRGREQRGKTRYIFFYKRDELQIIVHVQTERFTEEYVINAQKPKKRTGRPRELTEADFMVEAVKIEAEHRRQTVEIMNRKGDTEQERKAALKNINIMKEEALKQLRRRLVRK